MSSRLYTRDENIEGLIRLYYQIVVIYLSI